MTAKTMGFLIYFLPPPFTTRSAKPLNSVYETEAGHTGGAERKTFRVDQANGALGSAAKEAARGIRAGAWSTNTTLCSMATSSLKIVNAARTSSLKALSWPAAELCKIFRVAILSSPI